MALNYFSETLYSPKNSWSFPPNTFPQPGHLPCSIGLEHYFQKNKIHVN